MKFLLSILLLTQVTYSYACQCAQHPFKEAVASAAQIFQGIVVSKDNSVYPNKYKLIPTITWKGKKADTIEVYTGSGGGDCGFPFEIGEEYIVYSSNDRVSRCGRTVHIKASFDKERLDLLFLHPEKFPEYYLLNNQLSDYESQWLSGNLPKQLDKADSLTDKRVLFFYYDRCMNKTEFFDMEPGDITIEQYIPYKEVLLSKGMDTYGLVICNDYKKCSTAFYKKKARKYLWQ